MRKIFSTLFGVGMLLLIPTQNVQAAASFDALSYKPATDHMFYLTVESAWTLPQGKLHAGLGIDFSNDSLILVNAGGNKIRDIIGKQVAGHLGLAFGLFDWLNLGVLLDFIPYQEFTVPATGVGDNGARMGDIRLNMKLRLVDPENYPIGLALVPFITFPTGSDSHFTSEGKFTGGGQLVLETKRIGDRFSMSLNVGAQARKSTTLSQGTTIDDQFLYGVGANFAFNEWAEIIAEARGWTKFDDLFDESFRPLMARGALRFFPNPDVSITLGGGAAVINGMGAPTYEGSVSIAYVPEYPHYVHVEEPPCPDRDADTVCDVDDACPVEAGPAGNCGCPAEPKMVIDKDAKMIKSQKIFFEFNKANLKPESEPILVMIIESMKVRADIKHLRIIGHTDSVGSHKYNEVLSEGRAKSVRDYLTDQDIDPGRMSHYGKGETEPIDTNDTDEGRGRNRRVVFEIDIPESRTEAVDACKVSPGTI